MHIRKRGKNFPFLRKLDTEDGKVKHKLIGQISVDTESIDELEGEELWDDILTRREQGQLEEYLEKFNATKEERTKQKGLENTTKIIGEVTRLMEENASADLTKLEYDAELYINAFELLTQALIEDGYASSVATIAMDYFSEFIEEYELDEEGADFINDASKRLKKAMNKQGYTASWFKYC